MNEELKEILEGLSWGDLKRKAKNEFNYTPPRDATREDIIGAILRLDSNPNRSKVITDMASPIPPGWARIRLHTHDRASGKDPVVLNVNDGKPFQILRGAVVEIPIKHMHALQDARNMFVIPDNAQTGDTSKGQIQVFDVFEEENDYSFDVLGFTPGPDPRPTSYEKHSKIKHNERRKLAKQLGYNYLRDKQFKELRGNTIFSGKTNED